MSGWLDRRRLPVGGRRPGNKGGPKGSPGPGGGGGNGGGGRGGGRGRGGGGGAFTPSPEFAVVSHTVTTSAGTGTATSSGFGTPTAAIAYSSINTALNTVEASAIYGVGFTDGTTDWAISGGSVDASPNMNARSWTGNSFLTTRNFGSDTLSMDLDFSAWVTDGVQYTKTIPAPSVDRTSGIVLINGVQAKSGTFNPPTAGNSTSVNCGFQPTVVIILGAAYADAAPTGFSTNLAFNLGFATDDGSTVRQCAIHWTESFNAATGDPEQYIDSTRAFHQFSDAEGGGTDTSGTVSFTTTGFDFTITAGGGDLSAGTLGYLALNAGSNVWTGVLTPPTSTGTWTVTDTSFTPKFLMMVPTALTVIDTRVFTGDAGVLGLYCADGTTEIGMSQSLNQNAISANTEREMSLALDVSNHAGTENFYDGTFTAFTSTGFTMSLTQVQGTARKFPALMIG